MKYNRTKRQRQSDSRRQKLREQFCEKIGVKNEEVYWEEDAGKFWNMYKWRPERLKEMFRAGCIKTFDASTGREATGEELEKRLDWLVREWDL